MSTPWISRPRWTCKYCNVTLNDDVPSRLSHENGLRHKSNVERSLREAYKKSHRERAEEAEAKREMVRIERLAREAHAKDEAKTPLTTTKEGERSAGPGPDPNETPYATSSSAATSTSAKQSTKAWKPADRFAAYGSALPPFSTSDEGAAAQVDEERRLREWQAKREETRKAGTVGEWQAVDEPVASSAAQTTESNAYSGRQNIERPLPSSSSFKIREKQGMYERDEEGDGKTFEAIKVKKRMRTTNEAELQRRKKEEERELMPTWTPRRLEAERSAKQDDIRAQIANKEEPGEEVDDQHADADVKWESEVASAPLDATMPASSMFKKRKAGAGVGAKKVRAVI